MKHPLVCFIHIEKCGGITLHHIIQNNLLGYVNLRSWEYWSNKPGEYFSSRDLHRLRKWLPLVSGIGGHTTRCFAGYEDVVPSGVSYITFLRDPIARYLSHLNYQRQMMGINWRIDDFLADPRFNNYQTVRLAGAHDLDAAKRAVDTQLSFVGLVEEFDTSLVLLRAALPWLVKDVRYQPKNVAIGRHDPICSSALTTAQRERMEANNSLDIELYHHTVQNRIARQKREFGSGLELAVQEHRRLNYEFRYARPQAAARFLVRNMVRYGIQPVLRRVSVAERNSARRAAAARLTSS